jgi:hypothetical protein
LNSDSARKSLGLDDKTFDGVQVVQLRVNDGDDASCFNLNRAQRPRLLGVRPEQLKTRNAFGFAGTIQQAPEENPWELLNKDLGPNVVPAIGDKQMIKWLLGSSIGRELDYVDERGQNFRLRLVAGLKNSILQGSLIIASDRFKDRFPSEEGYRMFLIDAPEQKAEQVRDRLSAALTDFGLELTPTAERLAAFYSVEHTYLSIFQMLGGLGLVLGSAGLGLVVLRNVLDRRGELAMLQAVGLAKAALKRMVLYEHAGLMLVGLTCGVVAAFVAVAPALQSAAAEVPYYSLILIIAAIIISGVIWIWIAAVFALAGNLLEALRNE